MAKQQNVIRGSLSLTILALLQMQDMYGLQLISQIKKICNDQIYCPAGVIYPVLARLEAEGNISSKTVRVENNQKRIVYHIESLGEQYLEYLLNQYEKTTNGISLILQARQQKLNEKLCYNTKDVNV